MIFWIGIYKKTIIFLFKKNEIISKYYILRNLRNPYYKEENSLELIKKKNTVLV